MRADSRSESLVAQGEAGMNVLVLLLAPAACVVGEHPGVSNADALTVALLACEALRARGIAVGEPTADAGAVETTYRVEARGLGTSYLLRVARKAGDAAE